MNKFSKTVLLTSILYSAASSALTLEEATYIAIENDPAVRQAILTYNENKSQIEISQSGYKPTIDLNAGVGRETTYNDNADDVDLTRRELSLSFSQPLFRGFQTQNEVKRTQNETEASRWSALIAVENTSLSVAEAYSNVLRFRELLKLSDLNLKTHERIYSQIKLKSDTGVGRKSDLTLITARLAKAHSNRLAALNNLVDAKSQYLHVVGELPPENMIYPVPDRDLLPTTLEMAIEEAISKNPAIEVAKWDVKATENAKSSSDSANYPQLDLVVERTWDDNIDGEKGPSEDLLAMVRLNYNLYNGGSDTQRRKIAEQQILQATEIRRSTIRDTELTVRLAWAAYKSTEAQKKHIQQHVIATKQSQKAYESQFKLGRRTLLDVLDSENELFEARQSFVNADYDEQFAEFRLFNAKGELMRALRIYRPSILGFEDQIEDESIISTEQKISAIDKLKTVEAESINNSESSLPSSEELFTESETGSGW